MLSGILIARGINDGHDWEPVIGALLGSVSLGTGIIAHWNSGKAIAFSAFRKFINAVGSGLVTYGVINPDARESTNMIVMALGPVLAGAWSWLDNDNDEDGKPPSGAVRVLPFMLAASIAILAMPSCAHLSNIGARIDGDNCVLATYNHPEAGTYQAGPCIGTDGEISAYRVAWENDEGIRLRATRYNATGHYEVEYLFDGSWASWSSKSGISIGNAPVRIE